jgi:NAD(P)-dependent dehydrogenase (short-subunit alcohol dehydrogenase family)
MNETENQTKAPLAIVTGGGRGIGYGIAEELAKTGHSIVLADVDLDLAQASASKLKRDFGVEALAVTCDVTSRPSIQAALAATLEEFDRIDVLINNAGICPFVDVMEISDDVFGRTIDVNLIGPFMVTQEVARVMLDRQTAGRIIFITSLSVEETGPSQVDYAASKSGLLMLMKGFATALGPKGIRCNGVAPGWIYTDMTKFHWDKAESQATAKARIPLGRLGTPTDIGQVCAYLASDQSGYVNGHNLVVDGGHTALSG